jgi:hypothetical protein
VLVPITAKWFLVVNCDKDEWKIMVGNMKNDVGIWMFIKNQVARKAIRTLHLVRLCIYKEIHNNQHTGT